MIILNSLQHGHNSGEGVLTNWRQQLIRKYIMLITSQQRLVSVLVDELTGCIKMRFLSLQFVQFCVASLLCVVTLTIQAATLVGSVVGISDGDTIKVLDSNKTLHKIRLKGIDAPEKKQDFGSASKQALSSYIYQKEVIVEYEKKDRYQRILGKVILNERDICLAMISDGMAWHYKDYEKEQSKTDRDLYSQAEQKARKEKKGLWKDTNAVKPSDFRSAER